MESRMVSFEQAKTIFCNAVALGDHPASVLNEMYASGEIGVNAFCNVAEFYGYKVEIWDNFPVIG